MPMMGAELHPLTSFLGQNPTPSAKTPTECPHKVQHQRAVRATPGSAKKRNPHSTSQAARGFLPPRLSYASRRPKPCSEAAGPVLGDAHQEAALWPSANIP